jgi:tricarballylate dehydrogenase
MNHFVAGRSNDNNASIHFMAADSTNWVIAFEMSAMDRLAIGSSIYGGIKTDSSAHVLNTEGDRIPGLFAAGALVGVYYRKYAGATSVLRGATFGRIAGREAAVGLLASTPE